MSLFSSSSGLNVNEIRLCLSYAINPNYLTKLKGVIEVRVLSKYNKNQAKNQA